MLIKSLADLTRLFEQNKNEMSEHVPFYLTPSFLKEGDDELTGPVKVNLNPINLKKRKPETRSGDRFIMIDPNQEDPQFMDVSQLKSFSSRKEWKRKRGLLNKKKRLSKKDIKRGKHI